MRRKADTVMRPQLYSTFKYLIVRNHTFAYRVGLIYITCRTLGDNKSNKLWSGSTRPTTYCVYRLVNNEFLQKPHLDLCVLQPNHIPRARRSIVHAHLRNPETSRNVNFSTIATHKREHPSRTKLRSNTCWANKRHLWLRQNLSTPDEET